MWKCRAATRKIQSNGIYLRCHHLSYFSVFLISTFLHQIWSFMFREWVHSLSVTNVQHNKMNMSWTFAEVVDVFVTQCCCETRLMRFSPILTWTSAETELKGLHWSNLYFCKQSADIEVHLDIFSPVQLFLSDVQQYDHYSMSLAFYSFFCLVTVGLEEASQRIAPEFKQALESLWLMPLHNYVTIEQVSIEL